MGTDVSASSFDALRDGLFRLGRVMQRVDDLDHLLHSIIEECNTMLQCEAASVALYDPERGDLVFTVASGGSGSGITQWRMQMGQGIVGQVAESRESLYSNDPAHDPRWFQKIDNSSGFITKNLAAVPMLHGEELIGVVEALNRPDGDFTDDDLILLQIFADQCAQALEINRLIKAKQESERLATFAVALADIGHSTKNMLMRMEFPITLIDRAMVKGDVVPMKNSWDVMKRATKEIGQLVRDMLEYSKPRQPELSEVEVATWTRDVISDCRPDAESKNIELTLEGADEPIPWVLDIKILHAAVHNLVGNAIDAIAEHGGDAVRVVLDTTSTPGDLRLVVSDNGPGIPPDIQRRIFDPFFSTKGKKGTGIGLASVKKGVEEHGGRVMLDTAPGEGATFTLNFPQQTMTQAAANIDKES